MLSKGIEWSYSPVIFQRYTHPKDNYLVDRKTFASICPDCKNVNML